jgi:hypothetical protein
MLRRYKAGKNPNTTSLNYEIVIPASKPDSTHFFDPQPPPLGGSTANRRLAAAVSTDSYNPVHGG